MKINLTKIRKTMLKITDSDSEALRHLDSAIEYLRNMQEEMEKISVTGRDNVDALLGCMIGIDLIVGKEEDDG